MDFIAIGLPMVLLFGLTLPLFKNHMEFQVGYTKSIEIIKVYGTSVLWS